MFFWSRPKDRKNPQRRFKERRRYLRLETNIPIHYFIIPKGKEEEISPKSSKKQGHVKDEIGGWIRIPKKKEKEPIKDLDNLKPIDHGVIAGPHTPVYKMHRYFARRPWSVFNELIRHYSILGVLS